MTPGFLDYFIKIEVMLRFYVISFHKDLLLIEDYELHL